jgi:hypothetical protein
MRRLAHIVVIGTAASLLAWASAAEAATSVVIDGSFKTTTIRWQFTSRCPSGAADECGVFELVGLGPADYLYVYGPTFEPTGKKGCFNIDGTFTITLQSDGSRISGPLTGVFCGPGNSHAQAGTPSYGNPRGENDSISFSGGTGLFARLHGTVAYSEQEAGAHATARLNGTLSG